MTVLDVGCGSGPITQGIAEQVGSGGKVYGIDMSENLIDAARQKYSHQPNLHFEVADILSYISPCTFDLVTSARVLQWTADPVRVLEKMKLLLKPGGIIAILDYNHEKISWQPEPPQAMKTFYQAFLQWRQDAGFDNAIADHLKDMVNQIGLKDIQVSETFEISKKTDADFAEKAGIWLEVARLRGPQLVSAGYISEDNRIAAIQDYEQWITNTGQSMQLYLLAVEAIFDETERS